jgi:DnaJ-class molecular chaperone
MTGDPTGEMAPGDEAPSGTPGAGENVCPACGGSGQLDGATCRTCGGTGKVIEEVGGA